MKTIVSIILLVAASLYAAGLHIEINPFRIRFESLLTLLGWAAIVVGVLLIAGGQYEKGLKRGSEITIETLEEIVTEKRQINAGN